MSDPFSFDGDGQTPLEPDERQGLLPTWIATKGDLNEAEMRNIGAARRRWQRRPLTVDDLLDDSALRRLHADMFGDVWRWAGQYRTTDRNIGVAPEQIATQVRNLCDDALLWFQQSAVPDDVARVHHRLVAIHPFPNGNGRHGRLTADLLAAALALPTPTWSTRREDYLRSLRHADRTGDLQLLVSIMW